MAAHSSLVPVAPAAASTPFAAAAAVKRAKNATLAMQTRADAQRADDQSGRRVLVLRGLAAVGIGSLLVAAPEKASAAKRRSPPPPATAPEEKKDPNVSGVLAKVLASKKRKEAMKEAVAKLREKGSAVAVN